MASKIKISDGIGKVVSIWTEDDSSLTLESLNSVFFGATNLICPVDEREKVYLRIKNGRIYNPDGWDSNVVYLAHFGSRPTSPIQEMSFNVAIAKILPTLDCATLKSMSSAFPHHPVIHASETGMRAVCLGYPSFEDAKADGTLVEGQVHEKEPIPFPVEISALDAPRNNMFAAPCGLAHGFSGGGLFRVYGKSDWLLGICKNSTKRMARQMGSREMASSPIRFVLHFLF
uniref:Uncharacterized protein n=1 Tax=Acrobeloides nanus TaxID=290746 RepID=A0A914EG92_9BILA